MAAADALCRKTATVSPSIIFPPLFQACPTSLAQEQALRVLAWSKSPGIMQDCWQFFLGELYPRAPPQPGCIQGLAWVCAQLRAAHSHVALAGLTVSPAAVPAVVLYPQGLQVPPLPHKPCSQLSSSTSESSFLCTQFPVSVTVYLPQRRGGSAPPPVCW